MVQPGRRQRRRDPRRDRRRHRRGDRLDGRARSARAAATTPSAAALDATPSIALDGAGRAQAAWSRTPVAGRPVPGNGPGLWHAAEHANGSWTIELAVAVDGRRRVARPRDRARRERARRVRPLRRRQRGRVRGDQRGGSWVESRSWRPSLPATHVGWTRIAVGADDRVDVAWGSADGVVVATRTDRGTWGAPALATTRPAGRRGPRPRRARRCTSPSASSTDSATRRASPTPRAPTAARGRSTGLDTGHDVTPRTRRGRRRARAPALPARLAGARGPVRRPTRPAPGRRRSSMPGSNWAQPAFGGGRGGGPARGRRTLRRAARRLVRDGRGRPLDARAADGAGARRAGRAGRRPRRDARRSRMRSPSRADGTPLADPRGPGHRRASPAPGRRPGSPTTPATRRRRSPATPPATCTSRTARTPAGLDRLDVRDERDSGSWVVTRRDAGRRRAVGPASLDRASTRPARSTSPSSRSSPATRFPYGTVSIGYATNRGRLGVDDRVASGNEYRFDPSIAARPAGKPRIAYWLDNGGGSPGGAGGVRLATLQRHDVGRPRP